MKRTIIIAGAVIVVIVVALVIFFALQHGPTPSSVGTLPTTGQLPGAPTQNNPGGSTTGTNGTTGGTGTLTGANGQPLNTGVAATIRGFGPVSDAPVVGYFVDPQNNAFIIKTSGVITKITAGQSVDLSSLEIQGVLAGSFSFDGTKALVSFGDVTNPQASVFDLATKAWTSLPKGLLSPTWAPSDTRIAYFTASSAANTITLTTIDAANLKKAPVPLITLHMQDVTLRWLDKNRLIIADKPSALVANSAFLFDLQKRTLIPLIAEVNGADSIWTGASSSTPEIGLVFGSGPANRGGHLSLTDVSGTDTKNLDILTLPSKCAFSIQTPAASTTTTISSVATSTATSTASTTIKTTIKKPVAAKTPTPTRTFLYCAIPRDQNTLTYSYLPDDYNQMSLFTVDNILKIDVATGDVSPAFQDQSQNVDVSAMRFINNSLFFVNRYDQKLYGIIFN